MKGEFEKRIKEAFDDAEVFVDTEEYLTFLRVIDEARKDRPKPRLSRDWGSDPKGKYKYRIIATDKEWSEWFEKWFGGE